MSSGNRKRNRRLHGRRSGIIGSCDRKIPRKEANAKRAADRLGIRCYECQLCGMWHLTKKKRAP